LYLPGPIRFAKAYLPGKIVSIAFAGSRAVGAAGGFLVFGNANKQ
jgi:hypothetical protein